MRKTKMHKLLSWLLASTMLLGMLPISALAEGGAPHHQAGFADDGYYYTGVCTSVPDEGSQKLICDLDDTPADETTETAETHVHGDECYDPETQEQVCELSDEPAVEPIAPHVHGDDCYETVPGEETFDCERYAYITVTFQDISGLNEEATANLVPEMPEFSQSAPAFVDADNVPVEYWADDAGSPVTLTDLTESTTVFAMWGNIIAALPNGMESAAAPNGLVGPTSTYTWNDDSNGHIQVYYYDGISMAELHSGANVTFPNKVFPLFFVKVDEGYAGLSSPDGTVNPMSDLEPNALVIGKRAHGAAASKSYDVYASDLLNGTTEINRTSNGKPLTNYKIEGLDHRTDNWLNPYYLFHLNNTNDSGPESLNLSDYDGFFYWSPWLWPGTMTNRTITLSTKESPKETTTVTVMHRFGEGSTYTTVDALTETKEVANPTKDSLETLASTFAIPMGNTMEMATKDCYYLYKRANAEQDANNGWTLKLDYIAVRFYISTTKIAAGNAGAAFTDSIPGVITGVTPDIGDHDNSDQSRVQYYGTFNNIRDNVNAQVLSVNQQVLADRLSARGVQYNPETQHVVWYTIHEGYHIHVDGIVVDNAPSVTYHANYPGNDSTYQDEVPLSETGNLLPYTILGYDATEMEKPATAELLGWSDTPDGDVIYTAGQSDVTVSRNTNLYAKWKYNYTVAYLPGEHGDFEMETYKNLDLNANTPAFSKGTPTSKNSEFMFSGWTPEVSPTVTKDAEYTAQWIPKSDLNYTVSFYYQQADGAYLATNTDTRTGTAMGEEVSILDADKLPTDTVNYVLDDMHEGNVWTGKIYKPESEQDGPGLVLKVYFKRQLTVTYAPGAYGSFAPQTTDKLDYGATTPAFSGQTTANGSYAFAGWNPAVASTVTQNQTYTAQWTYTGGGNPGGGGDTGGGGGDTGGGGGDTGGGGGDTGGGDTGGDTTIPDVNPPQGPGPETNIPDQNTPLNPLPDVEIPDQETPLNPLPEEETTIVDEELPLGNLPQTGTVGKPADPSMTMGQLALAASLSAAGLSVVLLRKREEETD